MLKPPELLVFRFKENKELQENIFKYMCNFWSWEDYSTGIRAISYYLYVDNSECKYHILNPTPFERITGYIMEYYFSNKSMKKLPQKCMDLIDGYI